MVADPGLTLTLYAAEPGSPTAHALDLLASWTSPTITPAPPSAREHRTPPLGVLVVRPSTGSSSQPRAAPSRHRACDTDSSPQSDRPTQPRHPAGDNRSLQQQSTRPRQSSRQRTDQPTRQVRTVDSPPGGDRVSDPNASPTSPESDTVTTIRITVAGQTITGELNDTPTAQDLADQLPVEVTLADFNGVEKVGELPRLLTMDGVPAGADPEINDIGYYRPSNGLVFYYGDVGYFNGIVRLGRISTSDMQLIQRQTGSFPITIEAG